MLLVELEPSSKKQRPMRRRHQITKHRTKIAGWIVLTGLGLLLLFGGAIYQTLFPLSPVAIYNKKAATHYIYVDLEGVLPDGSSADGRYLVIGVEDDELIVMDERQRVYQTGQQLFSSQVTTDVVSQLQTTFETLKFNDENAVSRLRQLAASKPNAALIISGTLSVDLPEDIRIFDDPDQYPVATVDGNNIEFSYCPLERAIALLNNQYAIGTVTAKILQPKPQFIPTAQ